MGAGAKRSAGRSTANGVRAGGMPARDTRCGMGKPGKARSTWRPQAALGTLPPHLAGGAAGEGRTRSWWRWGVRLPGRGADETGGGARTGAGDRAGPQVPGLGPGPELGRDDGGLPHPAAGPGAYSYVWLDAVAHRGREGGRSVNVAAEVRTSGNRAGHMDVMGVDVFTTEVGAVWRAPSSPSSTTSRPWFAATSAWSPSPQRTR